VFISDTIYHQLLLFLIKTRKVFFIFWFRYVESLEEFSQLLGL